MGGAYSKHVCVMRHAYIVFVYNYVGKGPRPRWEGNIKMGLKEVGC